MPILFRGHVLSDLSRQIVIGLSRKVRGQLQWLTPPMYYTELKSVLVKRSPAHLPQLNCYFWSETRSLIVLMTVIAVCYVSWDVSLRRCCSSSPGIAA